MAFGFGSSGEGAQDINFNYNYLVVQTILKMRDAKADRKAYEYWVFFEFGIQLVLSHLEPKIAMEIQEDFNTLQVTLGKLRASGSHEQSKQLEIERLRELFADDHRYYIMKALNKIGIVKVAEEGMIDFDSINMETLGKIIRDSGSAAKNAERIDEEMKKVNAEKEGKVDELVYVDEKLVIAGSDEYKKAVDKQIDEKIRKEKREREASESNARKDVDNPKLEDSTFDDQPDKQISDTDDYIAIQQAESQQSQHSQNEKAEPQVPLQPPTSSPTASALSQFKLRIGYPTESKDAGS